MREYFEGMTDPRQEVKVRHSFIETIMIVICAVIAGCNVWEDIADYCRVKEEWMINCLSQDDAGVVAMMMHIYRKSCFLFMREP